MRNHSRVRRWAGGVVLLAFALCGLLYHEATDGERIRRRCEAALGRLVTGHVSIERAAFGPFEGIRLEGLRISEGGVVGAAADRPFLYCRSVLLRHRPWALLRGRLSVEEVVAVSPVCHLDRRDEDGVYNVSRLFRRQLRRPTAEKTKLPIVRLRNAALVVTREKSGELREVDRLGLSVVATPVPQTAGTYHVTWRRDGTDPATGRSRVNLEMLSFEDLEGGSPWWSLETGLLAVATQVPEADHWFGLLGLIGNLKAEGYNVSLRGGTGSPAQLTLRLRNASLSIPADEVEQRLPRTERYLSFEGVEGVVQLARTQAEVRFTGTFHGASCRVVATLTGEIGSRAFLDDVHVSAVITCEDFILPVWDEAAPPSVVRFLRRWRPLRSFYQDFDPHGRVSLEVSLLKESGAGQPVRLRRGVMTVLDADGAYRKFPYRVEHITGTVDVTPEGILLREIGGDHHGVPVVVNGWLAEARWYAATDVQVTGRSVAFDADLRAALNERYRKLWDTFEPTGTADITVDMHRGPGTEEAPQPYQTTVHAELADARARYRGFPYPVEGLCGGVVLEGDRLRVTRLRGSNGPAQVTVEGYADLTAEGLSDLDLDLKAQAVALDATLWAALPEPARAQVERLAPQGTFDLTGKLSFDRGTRQVTYDLAAELQGVQVTYSEVPVSVEQITGTVRVQPHEITLDRLSGRRGKSLVTVNGSLFDVGWHPGAPGARRERIGTDLGRALTHEDSTTVLEPSSRMVPGPCHATLSPHPTPGTHGEDGVWAATDRGQTQVTVACEGLEVDEALLSALPDRVGRVCRDLRITGPVNTVIRYEKSAESTGGLGRYHISIDPAGAAMSPEWFPYPLTLTDGTATVEAGRVTLEDLRARHGDGSMNLDGTLVFDEDGVGGDFSLSAEHILLDEELRLAVPWRWRRTWNPITPSGTIGLQLDRLQYRRERGAAAADWNFNGQLTLDRVDMDVGVRLRQARGVLVGSGGVVGAAGEPYGAAEVALDSVLINDRRVNSVWGRLDKPAPNGPLYVRDLAGVLYGGWASAAVQVDFGSPASRYEASATLRDVDLHDFLAGEKGPAPHLESVAGKLDAHLFLDGLSGDVESRRGGGRVHIGDGYLYRLPPLIPIIRELNFSAPREPTVQEADAEFFLTGRRVEVSHFLLAEPAWALAGSGTVLPASGTVALKLVSVTPHGWAPVPVLTEFIEGAARELVELDVNGAWHDPVIQAKPLRGVEATFDTLFEKKPPKPGKPVRPKKASGRKKAPG